MLSIRLEVRVAQPPWSSQGWVRFLVCVILGLKLRWLWENQDKLANFPKKALSAAWKLLLKINNVGDSWNRELLSPWRIIVSMKAEKGCICYYIPATLSSLPVSVCGLVFHQVSLNWNRLRCLHLPCLIILMSLHEKEIRIFPPDQLSCKKSLIYPKFRKKNARVKKSMLN